MTPMTTEKPFPRRLLLLLVAAAAAIAAAGALYWSLVRGDGDATGEGATGSTAAPPQGEDPADGGSDQAVGAGRFAGTAPQGDPAAISPTFVEGTCQFPLPAGTSPRCGTVAVPMNWDTGEGEIVLPVAVFPTTAGDPAGDPVIYLEGGPGGHALETIEFVVDDVLEPLRERGEVVFFDQRGVGLSQPQLGCEEVTELDRELEDDPDVSDEEVNARFYAALGACSSRLAGEGIDLGQFNSIANAHDVEAIRLALGYDQWNLYGISYGTKLGLEVMRQHPEAVRAAVLDSVFPPHIDSALENPTTFLDSYQAVVDACGREPACAAGGDLGARIREVVLAYDADPVQVEVQDYLSGVSDDVYADGETIVGVVTQALYSPLWFTDLPELVAELEAGETGALEQFLSQQRTNEPFFSTGMFYAFECNEEVVFADRDEVAAAVPPDPFGLFETFEYASNSGTFAFDTCEAFGTVAAPPESNEAVTSDIPTLLMAGAFDPVTPVSWAEAAAETLPNSFTVVAPTEAHGVSPGRCGMGVMRQFLDDPATEPDASCYAGGALQFLGVPDEEIVLEPVTLEYPASGVTISTVRPEDWDHGQLPGDSYRQASFLDVTQIVQVVGDSSLSFGLEIYLSDTWGIEVSEATERPGLHGRDWQYRSGQSDQAAVEWYETEIDGSPTFVVLVSSPQELEHHIDTVLDPVLESIDVE